MLTGLAFIVAVIGGLMIESAPLLGMALLFGGGAVSLLSQMMNG